jgi:hypothetical protein
MREAHIDPLDLVEYARGALGRARAEAIRQHCERCDDCGGQLLAVFLVREAHGVEPAVGPRGNRYRAAAAAAILLVGATALWSVFVPATPRPESTVVPRIAEEPGSASASEVVDLPASLAGGLRAVLMGIEVESGIADNVAVGSEDVAVVTAARHLRRGDAEAVVQSLRARTGSADPRVDLLLGIAELLRGEPVAASAPLGRVAANPVAGEASYRLYWRAARLFLAEARYRVGDVEGAEALLDGLAEPGGSENDWIRAAAAERLVDMRGAAPRR